MRSKRVHYGQSMIEFSLLFPLVLLLVLGLFEVGRVIFYFAVLNNAVREGTRYAVVQPGCDYTSNPSECTSGYIGDENLAICNDASSEANKRVCEEIKNNYLFVGELSNSTITIEHIVNNADDPVIHIRIEFNCVPTIPGLGIIGTIPIRVNSQMLMTPAAQF